MSHLIQSPVMLLEATARASSAVVVRRAARQAAQPFRRTPRHLAR